MTPLVPNMNVWGRGGWKGSTSRPDICTINGVSNFQPPLTFTLGTNGVSNYQMQPPLTFMLGTNGSGVSQLAWNTYYTDCFMMVVGNFSWGTKIPREDQNFQTKIGPGGPLLSKILVPRTSFGRDQFSSDRPIALHVADNSWLSLLYSAW